MICNSCKTEIEDGNFFCPNCGASLNEAVNNIHRAETRKAYSEKVIWVMAIASYTAGMLLLFLPFDDKKQVVQLAVMISSGISRIAVLLDIKQLEKKIKNITVMFLIGFFISPGAYIIMRENKTNKNYKPFVVYLLLSIAFFFVRRKMLYGVFF
jgi:hypothetical protein